MKKIQLWMLAAILTICGQTVLTSCSDDDDNNNQTHGVPGTAQRDYKLDWKIVNDDRQLVALDGVMGNILRAELDLLHDVAQLQRAAVLEGGTREVFQLRGVGQEADVDGLHHVAGVKTLHGGDADDGILHLGRGIEDAQLAQLYADALCHQFGQTLGDLDEDGLDVAAVEDAAVVNHVLCEATDGEGLLTVDLRIILAEGKRL